MKASERYKRRRRLRKALLRMMEILADNAGRGIEPDLKTADMAAQVVRNLMPFIKAAAVSWQQKSPDLSLFLKLRNQRRSETVSRRRRRRQ
jgi:hypothetical protein